MRVKIFKKGLKMIKLILGVFALLIINGCGGMKVMSNVTTFHKISPTTEQVLFAFKPFPSQKNNLEYETYAGYISQQLSKYNYILVPTSKASVIVQFDYSIDSGRTVTGSAPTWGQTGVSSSSTYTTGNVYGTVNTYGNYGTYSGSGSAISTTTYTPTYGVTGYRTVSATHYTRELFVKMLDKKTQKIIYNARVDSRGQSNQISAVMPYLVKSLFQEFPGKSGTSKTVTLPLEK